PNLAASTSLPTRSSVDGRHLGYRIRMTTLNYGLKRWQRLRPALANSRESEVDSLRPPLSSKA
ncbi:hypothetical protein, partial [Xanthomonas euvesicatoria]|uniref:hypothetical protein n=1 Tax=Xanthomonas euvesicatoria TaxID=456327 RepID=UPI0019D20576